MPAASIVRGSRRIARTFGFAALLGLSACSASQITEDTPTSVSVRYDGVFQTLDDATATANKACAAYRKNARLRDTYIRAVLDRVAHFDCVSG
jgi:hypothetical protein